MGSYSSQQVIRDFFELSEKELESIKSGFPVLWPKNYLDLAQLNPAIARMGRPDMRELDPDEGDFGDPVSDKAMRPVPFLVRKHREKVILLVTKNCHFYCRFCFRRSEPHSEISKPGPQDWQNILSFLSAHPEIEEPILSGGDPLTLSNAALDEMLGQLLSIPSVKKVRIHSRAPVHFPERIDDGFLDLLSRHQPVILVTHFNHVGEFSLESCKALKELGEFAILKNQAVLLAGVNDTFEAQIDLWRACKRHGLLAHHLHHPDRAPGNAHFRVDIQSGLALFKRVKAELGLSAPDYVLDLPDGSGKIEVQKLVEVSPNSFRYFHKTGQISDYQDITTQGVLRL